jgi:hypothetical protein
MGDPHVDHNLYPLRGRERLHLNLRTVARDLAQAESQSQLITILLNTINRIFQSDVAIVFLTDLDTHTLKPHVAQRATGDTRPIRDIPLSGCSPRVLEAPYHWPSAEVDPIVHRCQFHHHLSELGFATWFSLPIRRKGTVLGLIAVGYYHYEYLVEDVVQILWEFAQDVAQALLPYLPSHLQRQLAETGSEPEVPTLYQQRRMRRLLTNHFQLTNSLWTDDNLSAIAKVLAQVLRQPVTVMDRYLGVLCSAPADVEWRSPLTKVRQWIRDHQLLPPYNHPFPVRTDRIGEDTFVVAPIQMGDSPLGCVLVWERLGKLDDLDVIALQQACTVLAVHFYKRGLHIERRGNGFQELFNLLLDTPHAWGPQQVHEARALGWEVDSPQQVLVARFAPADPVVESGAESAVRASLTASLTPTAHATSSSATPLDNRDVSLAHDGSAHGSTSGDIAELLGPLRLRLAAEYPQVLVARRQDALVFLLPASAMSTEDEQARFLRWLQSLTEASLPAETGSAATHEPHTVRRLCFGLSGVCHSAQQLVKGYQEAFTACLLAPLLAPASHCLRTEEIPVYLMLRPLAQTESVHTFVNQRLAAIRQYDAEHQAEFLKTLRVYLAHNGNISDTAAELFIHRTTLQYRLRRIEQLLGRDLESAQTRFELQLALVLDHLCSLPQIR